MPTIIFTAGAKGGTGKSTAMCFLVNFLREHQLNPLLIDMDKSSGTLQRYFPEAETVDIKKASSHDVLIEKVNAGEKLIVADLKAGIEKDTLAWWLDVPFEDFPDAKFICVGAITHSPDSVQSFLEWAAALKNQVSYVVCKNQKDGEAFPDYEVSGEALNFQESYNPIEVLIPRLDEEYMTELERLNLTVAEALAANGNETINGKKVGDVLCRVMVRARLRRFQRGIYEQFEPVLKLLNV